MYHARAPVVLLFFLLLLIELRSTKCGRLVCVIVLRAIDIQSKWSLLETGDVTGPGGLNGIRTIYSYSTLG